MRRDRRLGIFKPDLYECNHEDILCSDRKKIPEDADDEVYDENAWIYEEEDENAWIYEEEDFNDEIYEEEYIYDSKD